MPRDHTQEALDEYYSTGKDPTGGDIGATFGLTSDATGLVGMKHFLVDGKASIDTLMMTGVTFYAEDLGGVFKGTIA